MTLWAFLTCCAGAALRLLADEPVQAPARAPADSRSPLAESPDLGNAGDGRKSVSFDPDGIGGALVLCGGGRLPSEVRDEFVRLAGGNEARLVIIPTASDEESVAEDAAEVADIWSGRGVPSIAVLHTRSRDMANVAAFVAPLTRATAVWISGGRQSQIAAAYSGTLVERELAALVSRGGVVGGTSAGAACQSRVMIVRGQVHPTPGLGLVPGALVDQHFLARDRRLRLLTALAAHPELVGFGIDEGTALIVEGRGLRCVGDSTVTICFGATGRREPEETILRAGDRSDLTMLRRAARERVEPAFPPAECAPAEVPRGSLVLVGGGQVPEEVVQRFIDLAGGVHAPLVVLPTAQPAPADGSAGEQTSAADFLERAGATCVRVLSQRRRDEVAAAEFLRALAEARGVWFAGGRQWRFVDAYEGTPAAEAFRGVLERGGVIGGTSAGATIQGEYLVRGSPLGNEEMMCAGYQRGLAFLPGTAIDQHVAQRRRFADMTAVVAAHPQLLGIGLDESTALVVQGATTEVLGKGQVHFYDRRRPNPPGVTDYVSLSSGERYQLVERRPVD